MKRRGFTIIELLMVVAVLAILMGIITTAVTASIRQSRGRRAEAMKQTLQNGIAAYRQLKDKWPGKLEDLAKDPPSDRGTVITLNKDEYDNVVQALLKVSVGKSAKNRVMDPIGLMVMGKNGEDGKASGLDFRAATEKGSPYAKRLSKSEITVVYQDGNGKARRYRIDYNTEADSVTVRTQ